MSVHADGSQELGPERATFIVRLVRERRAGSTWRGEVEYVQQGERRPAGDPQGVLEHLATWLKPLQITTKVQRPESSRRGGQS